MASGTVKWFNGPSGFGVITADTGGGELFVYRGSLLVAGATLDAGDRVEFEAHEGGMGAQAVDVQRAGAPSEDAFVPRRGRSVLAADAADDTLRDTAGASRKEGVMVRTHLGESALRRESEAPDARAVRLDWHEFSARLFPNGRRHDLEAIAAYGAYRAHAADRPPEHARSALVGSAVMVWDWEGGAAAVEDSSGEEVSERVRTAGIQ